MGSGGVAWAELASMTDSTEGADRILSHEKSQFSQKSVNLSLIITDVKNTLTDLCGN